jgi:hypothetical protein
LVNLQAEYSTVAGTVKAQGGLLPTTGGGSGAGTGLLTVTWGFLGLAGLPRLPVVWVFPILIWLWGIGAAMAARRYQ